MIRSGHGSRLVIDDRTYQAKALGGGRFEVLDSTGASVGTFTLRGGTLETEDQGVPGAHSVETIALLWAKQNLSSAVAPKLVPKKASETAAASPAGDDPGDQPAEGDRPPSAPEGAEPAAPAAGTSEPAAPVEAAPDDALAAGPQTAGGICRLILYNRPDAAALARAGRYHAWLRMQPGVKVAYLTHDSATGKAISVSVWESKEALTGLRYAKPPPDALPLDPVKVEQLSIVG